MKDPPVQYMYESIGNRIITVHFGHNGPLVRTKLSTLSESPLYAK